MIHSGIYINMNQTLALHKNSAAFSKSTMERKILNKSIVYLRLSCSAQVVAGPTSQVTLSFAKH